MSYEGFAEGRRQRVWRECEMKEEGSFEGGGKRKGKERKGGCVK